MVESQLEEKQINEVVLTKLYLGRTDAPEGFTKAFRHTEEFSNGTFKLDNPDGSVDEITCEHLFHLVPGPLRGKFMDELHRVLVKGGKVTISVPYYAHTRAIQDFMHAWPPVCEASFLYFDKEWRTNNKIDYPVECDFSMGYGYQADPETANKNEETRSFWIKHYLNAITDLVAVLVKK